MWLVPARRLVLKELPEKFKDLFNEYRNQYMATHVDTAAVVEANNISDRVLEARQNETDAAGFSEGFGGQERVNFDLSHITEQERIIKYAGISSHALSAISVFPGVSLQQVKENADEAALNHVLEEGQRLGATWANTPDLRKMLQDHIQALSSYEDIRGSFTNHTTLLSSDTTTVSPEHHQEEEITRLDLPPGFVESYLSARAAYLAGIERRHVSAVVHAASETVKEMKSQLTKQEYKDANTAIAALGGGPYPDHQTHMSGQETLARNREALYTGLSKLENRVTRDMSSSDLKKLFKNDPVWKEIPASSQMHVYDYVKKYEQEEKSSEEQLQIGDSSPRLGIPWNEVINPKTHGNNDLAKSLHENSPPDIFGIPSESELEHTADQEAARDLDRQEPGSHFDEHEYQSATYNAQTHVLSTLGLSHDEQAHALYLMNRDAILGAIGSGQIPAQALHDHPKEFQDFTSLHNHASRFDAKPGDHDAIYNDQYSSALLHERSKVLQSIESEVKTANEISLNNTLNDFEAQHLSETTRDVAIGNVAKLRATLEQVGHGNTSHEQELDAINRYMNGQLTTDDLLGVPKSFLADFKTARKEAMFSLPTIGPMTVKSEETQNTGEDFSRMREMADNVHQGLVQSTEFDHLPIPPSRRAYASIAINHFVLKNTLRDMNDDLPAQFKDHLERLLNDKPSGQTETNIENTLQLISSGAWDSESLSHWTLSALPTHLLTRAQSIAFWKHSPTRTWRGS